MLELLLQQEPSGAGGDVLEGIWTDIGSKVINDLKTPGSTLAVSDGNRIIAGLGNTGSLKLYDFRPYTAVQLASSPIAVKNTGYVLLDGKIYIYGAVYPADDNIRIYDSVNNTWSVGAAGPNSIGYGWLAGTNGKVYYIGGMDRNVGSTNKIFEYDPLTNAWTEKNPAPQRVDYYRSIGYDSKIYLYGGRYNGQGDTRSSIFKCYDPATDAWVTLPNAPKALVDPTLVIYKDHLYLVGGNDGTSAFHLSRYSFEDNEWYSYPSVPGSAIFNCGAAVLGSKIYIFGDNKAFEIR